MKKYENKIGVFFKYFVLTIIVLSAVSLFVYIFVSAFKPLNEVMVRAKFFPRNPTLSNFNTLFFENTPNRNFIRFLLNSLFISFLSALVCCVISALASYGFSRYEYI